MKEESQEAKMKLSPELASELEDLKTTRTTHLTALKVQADYVINACTEQVTKVDFVPLLKAWSEFSFEQDEYSQFCADNNINDSDSIENNMTIVEYAAHAKSVYENAKSVYTNYLRGTPLDMKPVVSSSFVSSVCTNSTTVTSNVSQDLSFLRAGYGHQEYPQWDGKPGLSWLEFKTSWLQEVVPLFPRHQLTLARLLRKQIGGDGKEEIKHISLSEPDCYELMWGRSKQSTMTHFSMLTLSYRVLIALRKSMRMIG